MSDVVDDDEFHIVDKSDYDHLRIGMLTRVFDMVHVTY